MGFATPATLYRSSLRSLDEFLNGYFLILPEASNEERVRALQVTVRALYSLSLPARVGSLVVIVFVCSEAWKGKDAAAVQYRARLKGFAQIA